METWGELFWDAWIRLRLACRRLYRTYWPPQFKAWQVCTATGVVSILLTLVVLNLPSTKTDLQAKEDEPPVPKAKPAKKGAADVDLVVESTDPFADANLTEPQTADSGETIDPPSQADTLDDAFDQPTRRPFRTREIVAANPSSFNSQAEESPGQAVPPASDPTFDEASEPGVPAAEAADLPAEQPTLVAPTEETTAPVVNGLELSTQPEAPLTESMPEEPESTFEFANQDAETAPRGRQATSAPFKFDLDVQSEPEAEPETPASVAADRTRPATPDRAPDHYSRFDDHDDHIDQQRSDDPVQVKTIHDAPPVKRHLPFQTPLRPKGHYGRLGEREDTEEDRHSVQDIRATRTGSIPIPGGTVVIHAPQKELAQGATEEATPPQVELPSVPTEPMPAEPMESQPAIDAESAFEAPADEPVAGTTPPVLFAPEPEITLPMPDAVTPAPEPRDYHGPVDSTDASDHEAHIEEDAFSRPVRKTLRSPIAADEEQPPVPQPAEPQAPTEPVTVNPASDHEAHIEEDAFSRRARKVARSPVAADEEQPPPDATPSLPVEDVKSTDGLNHEAHAEEDAFDRPIRRPLPSVKVAPPAEEEAVVPAPEPMPVVEDPAVPAEEPMPAEGEPEVTPNVKSSEPADHEAHEAEDAFHRPTRKLTPRTSTPPVEEVMPQAEEEPVATESQKPAGEEPAEPANPHTPRRTPHVIFEEAGSPASETEMPRGGYDEVPLLPTGPRNSERVTIPDRIPAETLPTQPVVPLSRDDTEFTAASSIPKPATASPIVMEITGPRLVPVGTQVVMHFKLQNVGTTPVTGIVVSDVLPTGLQHRQSADLEYRVARLNPGETRETNLTVQCVSAGSIINKAVLRADGDVSTQAEFQLQVTDGAGVATQPRTQRSALSINHHGPEHWLVDSTGQFLVTVTNNSSETLKNVTITQSYPQGTRVVHATVGHKNDEKNRVVSWTISEFGPGVSYILETELHSLTSGPGTSIARIKVGETPAGEDRWTAVSYSSTASMPATRR